MAVRRGGASMRGLAGSRVSTATSSSGSSASTPSGRRRCSRELAHDARDSAAGGGLSSPGGSRLQHCRTSPADGSFIQLEGRWSDWRFPPGSFGDEPGTLDGAPVLAMSVAGMLAMKEQYPHLRNGGHWRAEGHRRHQGTPGAGRQGRPAQLTTRPPATARHSSRHRKSARVMKAAARGS